MKKQGWWIVALVIAGIAFYLWRDAREAIEQEAEPASGLSETVKPARKLVEIASAGHRMEPPRVYALKAPAEDLTASQVEPGPEYGRYTGEELRSLATSSAEAAVAFARRLESDTEAEQMYERAVVLSGKPGPLVEWMYARDQGGIEHYSGVLNVDKAALGYEVALVQARFPYAPNTTRDAVAYYETLLEAEHVALAPIRARAAERFERLSRERIAIVGWPWESQT